MSIGQAEPTLPYLLFYTGLPISVKNAPKALGVLL